MFKQSLLIALASLFLFVTLVNCQWEGIWTDGTYNLTVCEADNMIHFRISSIGFAYARLSDDALSVKGKYFLVGDKYTGTRATFGNFYAGRGRLTATYNAVADTITSVVHQKGALGISLNSVYTRLSSSVGDDRVWNCAIIDRSSVATVNGYWLSNDKSAITAHLCVSERRLQGSYTFHFNYDGADTILPGYYIGYCALDGMICGGVYYQNDTDYETFTTFGAETAVRLSDDRLLLAHTRGAPGIHGWAYKVGVNQLDRQATSTTECATYSSSYFNPTKCHLMEKDLCKEMEGYGFCEYSNDLCSKEDFNATATA